jgi:predicted site-specific integrase-resolvase
MKPNDYDGISIPEVAEALFQSRETLATWCRIGRIKHAIRIRGVWWIRRDQFRQLAKEVSGEGDVHDE